MTRIFRPLLVFLVVAGFVVPALAEEAAPKVRIVQNGAENLYTDLEFVLSLTNEDEQKQWDVIKDYLDVFIIGIDPQQPIRMDLVLTDEVRRYISSFPITSLAKFRKDNLTPLTIKTRKRSTTLYRVSNTFEGYMRYKHKYAIFAEKKSEVPVKIAHPIEGVQHLLDKGFDVGLELTNESDGQDERRTRFHNDRKEVIDALKQTKNETPEDFQLRKKFYETQLDELERFYVESQRIEVGWTLDTKKEKKHGQFDLQLVPMPDTPLAASVKQTGTKTSAFAGVGRSDDSILSLRLTHPLDEMRIENFSSLFSLFAERTKGKIEAASDLSDDQKKAAIKIADEAAAMFIEITKSGLADGFLEAHANASGNNTLVGGFKAVDGNRIVKILNLIPAARDGQTIEMNLDQQGDVTIHKAVISADKHINFKGFFGSEDLYVGSSPNAVWFALGENALTELKATIEKSAQPSEGRQAALFFDFFAKMGPWIDLRHQRDPKAGDISLRHRAIEAFAAGEDTFSIQLKKDEDDIVGNLIANPGILRFAGTIIANFSKENLEGDVPAAPAAPAAPADSKTAKKSNKQTNTN